MLDSCSCALASSSGPSHPRKGLELTLCTCTKYLSKNASCTYLACMWMIILTKKTELFWNGFQRQFNLQNPARKLLFRCGCIMFPKVSVEISFCGDKFLWLPTGILGTYIDLLSFCLTVHMEYLSKNASCTYFACMWMTKRTELFWNGFQRQCNLQNPARKLLFRCGCIIFPKVSKSYCTQWVLLLPCGDY